jgi:hypothetical protein
MDHLNQACNISTEKRRNHIIIIIIITLIMKYCLEVKITSMTTTRNFGEVSEKFEIEYVFM